MVTRPQIKDPSTHQGWTPKIQIST